MTSPTLSNILGVARYEFRMQIRRPSLWVTFAVLAAYAFLVATGGPANYFQAIHHGLANFSLFQVVSSNVSAGQQILPIAVGCLLADRLRRDSRLKVEELINTTPIALSARLAGKFLGVLAASATPLFLVYALFQGVILVISQNVLVIPLFLLSFLIVSVPGLLFVAAFSLAVPKIMPVLFYQCLFAGYWLWGNLFVKQHAIPTLSRTILTPSGVIIQNGLFHTEGETIGVSTPIESVESIVLLVSIAALVMFVLWGFLKWQQSRQ